MMDQLHIEAGRVISIANAPPPKSHVAIIIGTIEGNEKQILLYQGRQPLALVAGEQVSCIVNDTGTSLQGLALVNHSRHIHQETPPRSSYFQNHHIFFFVYLIALEAICLIFFDPRQGNTSRIVLFMGVFFLGLLLITPFMRRWSRNQKEASLIMTRVRNLMQKVLSTQDWGREAMQSPPVESRSEREFPQNKKGQFFTRIWRPAPGSLVETPPLCPYCNVDSAMNIGPHVFDEKLSAVKKPLVDPPILKVHVCEHHYATLNPRALVREDMKMFLAIFGIELGVPLFIIILNSFVSVHYSIIVIETIISFVVANVLFLVYGYKRILKRTIEKEAKFWFGSWKRKQITIYVKNGRWMAAFAQMHSELIAPVREI